MHKLYKPTTWDRETVTQEARVVLGPDEGAPAGSIRHVQIVLPDSPTVFIGLDKQPEDIAMSRTYNWPLAPTDFVIRFDLLPEQFISAVASVQLAELSIIVEYREKGGR